MERLMGVDVGDRLPRSGNAFTRWLGRTLMWLLGGWRIEGDIPDQPKLIAAVGPHTSNWDFVVIMPMVLALGIKISYFAKHTLFIRPFNVFFEWLGGMPLDRRAPHGVVNEMAKAFEENDQLVLGLSPEGTRSKVTGLKSGFLEIARAANVPVVLIGWDFKNKVITFGPVMRPTENREIDKQFVEAFFASQIGKKPELA